MVQDTNPHASADFRTFISRAMEEENLSFEMDQSGGVHFRVDEAFQEGKAAALVVLGYPDAIAARTAFDDAHRLLTMHPTDMLGAVRRAFDAVENIFKSNLVTVALEPVRLKLE